MTNRVAFILALLTTVLMSLLYVRSRFLLVELSYKVMSSQKEKELLEQQKRALLLELATLQSPRRIEKIARNKLNLSEALTPNTVVFVNKSHSQRTP